MFGFFNSGEKDPFTDDPVVQSMVSLLRTNGRDVEVSAGRIKIRGSFVGAFTNKDQFVAEAEAIMRAIHKAKGQQGETPRSQGRPHNNQRTEIAEDPQVTIKRLRESGRKIIEQREDWKRRALSAELQVETLNREIRRLREAAVREKGNDSDGKVDSRYSQLRKFIAMEFHPDKNNSSAIERAMKQEIFKILWSEVERIEKA